VTTPECAEARLLLQAELDGELEPGRVAGLAAHVADCPGCAAARQELGALSRALRATLPYHPASAGLREALAARLTAEPPAPQVAVPPLRLAPAARWWPAGAGFVAGLALAASLALVLLPRGAPPPSPLADEAVASHIRALQGTHLLDVATSDQHQVKPWFDGRLDFAPPVRDLAAQGFALEGGRLDYLDGRPVAALVYRRAQHVLNLFLWPGEAEAPRVATVQGYTVLRWGEGGMRHALVSDLNRAELESFVRLWKAGG
jgi:anti-sigma factor RsiW